MEKSLQIFNNPQFGDIRIVINKNNEPMFAGIDVAKVLGYANPNEAISMHCKSGNIEKLYTPHSNGVGGVNIMFIKETEIYRLVMKYQLPDAEKFQDWVCEDVLPSIRKHGAYITPQKIEEALLNPDIIIQLATNLKEEQQKRISAETQIEAQKPKVLFADAIIASDTSVLIGRLANVLMQNGVDIGQNRLFKWMRDNGYLCKFGERYNQPTQYSMDLGLFEVTYNTVVRPEKSFQTITTKVTGKGQIYFVEKFLSKKHA